MKKVFLIGCIVAIAVLGLGTLPQRTATADSEFVIGDLSKLAQELEIVPEDNGRYTLADILEAFYAKIENNNKRLAVLESKASEMSSTLYNLQIEVRNIRQEDSGISSDQLNDLAEWTEDELNKVWNYLNGRNIENRLLRIERQLQDSSGHNLDYQLSQMDSRILQIEWTLQEIKSSASNDYRLDQIEWKLNDLQNQIDNLRW